jgi:hypothetical protein
MSGLLTIFLNIAAFCAVLGATFHYYAKLQEAMKRNRTETFDFGRAAAPRR